MKLSLLVDQVGRMQSFWGRFPTLLVLLSVSMTASGCLKLRSLAAGLDGSKEALCVASSESGSGASGPAESATGSAGGSTAGAGSGTGTGSGAGTASGTG